MRSVSRGFIVGPKGSKANPICCCGGSQCDPEMTLEGAAEEIRRILSAEGFEDVSVTVEDPSDPSCDHVARRAAESSPDLIPLVMVDHKVAAYGGVKPDLLLRILRKMKGV